MTQKELDILTNIIGGVESGGQTYGKRNYGSYIPPYTNTDTEVTCTLGWAQNYGNRARKLCQMIYDTNKTEFKKADSANIKSQLKIDWEGTKWRPTAAQKNALVDIITSETGKKCQDLLFQESAKEYITNAENNYGIKDVSVQMMACEIQHLSGRLALDRILKRAKKPYTVDTVFDSLILDQKDTSNNNQVGDKIFQSRHECCVKWIKEYVINPSSTTDKGGVNIMTGEEIREAVGKCYDEIIGRNYYNQNLRDYCYTAYNCFTDSSNAKRI